MNIAVFIHGKAAAGKDTFVRALENEAERIMLPENIIVKMPFADEVRKELCRLDPTVDFNKLCNDYDYKTQYRKQLVEIGDGYRQSNPGIWVDKHYISLKEFNLKNKGKIVCVPDMRYSTNNAGDELAYAQEIGKEFKLLSFTVKIKADLSARLYRMSKKAREQYLLYGMYNDSENAMNHVPDSAFSFVCENTFENPYFNDTLSQAANEIIKIYDLVKNI